MSAYTNELAEDEVIPLYFDKCFKLTFGDYNHVELLNYLLSTVLKKKVEVISLLNTELIGDNRKNKKNSVDLVCKLEGAYVHVEVNTSFGQDVKDRNLSFLFRLESKELKPGEDYKEISNYYQINFNLEDFDNEHFNVCHVNSDNTGLLYSKSIEIININISYYAELCYNITNKELLSETDKIFGVLGTKNKSVINKVSKDNKILEEIGDIVKKFSEDDELIFEYNKEKLVMNDMKKVLTERVTKEVTEEVTKEVTEKTTLDIARKMKRQGINISDIEIITGLSKDIIDKL